MDVFALKAHLKAINMIVEMDILTPCLTIGTVAFLSMVAVISFVRFLALKFNYVDNPGGRKQHDQPVPPIGGICIFIVFLAFMIAQGALSWAVYASLALVLVVGIVDDAFGMNARLKFALHFLSALILVIGGDAVITSLGNILGLGELSLGIMAIPFSVACIVYILNAVNMMDGVDGLAGGNSLLILGWLLAAAAMGHWMDEVVQIMILMVAIAGFLVYNMRTPWRKRASVFLGDAGSMALGLMIAWYCIRLSQQPVSAIAPVSIAWIIALPIIDSFGLLVARLKERRPPFEPDRRHFHHHFLNAGFLPQQTTPLILLWSFLLGSIGFFGVKIGLSEAVLGWGWIILWWGHALLVIKSERFISFLQSFVPKTQHQ